MLKRIEELGPTDVFNRPFIGGTKDEVEMYRQRQAKSHAAAEKRRPHRKKVTVPAVAAAASIDQIIDDVNIRSTESDSDSDSDSSSRPSRPPIRRVHPVRTNTQLTHSYLEVSSSSDSEPKNSPPKKLRPPITARRTVSFSTDHVSSDSLKITSAVIRSKSDGTKLIKSKKKSVKPVQFKSASNKPKQTRTVTMRKCRNISGNWRAQSPSTKHDSALNPIDLITPSTPRVDLTSSQLDSSQVDLISSPSRSVLNVSDGIAQLDPSSIPADIDNNNSKSPQHHISEPLTPLHNIPSAAAAVPNDVHRAAVDSQLIGVNSAPIAVCQLHGLPLDECPCFSDVIPSIHAPSDTPSIPPSPSAIPHSHPIPSESPSNFILNSLNARNSAHSPTHAAISDRSDDDSESKSDVEISDGRRRR